MKIALVAEYVDPQRGGAETSVAQFLNHLIRLNMEIDLYTRSTVASRARMSLHIISTPRTPRFLRTWAFSRAVDQWIPAGRHDLVHAITPCLTADIYQPRGGLVLETIRRNLAIYSPTARVLKSWFNWLNFKQQLMGRLERALLTRQPPPAVIAISHYVVDQLKEHYAFDPKNIHLIFNGVDQFSFSRDRTVSDGSSAREILRKEFGVTHEDKLALFVAHNFKLKGLGCWIRALSEIKRRNRQCIKSLVVGKGKAASFLALARRLNVDDRIIFVGPASSINPYFQAADFCVHPTYYDPCSRVVLEAMLSGIPALTTRFNGAAEIIEDGITGRVIDSPDHIVELASAAEQLCDPKYRIAARQRHDEYRKKLSMERHVQEMVELYRQLHSQRRHSL